MSSRSLGGGPGIANRSLSGGEQPGITVPNPWLLPFGNMMAFANSVYGWILTAPNGFQFAGIANFLNDVLFSAAVTVIGVLTAATIVTSVVINPLSILFSTPAATFTGDLTVLGVVTFGTLVVMDLAVNGQLTVVGNTSLSTVTSSGLATLASVSTPLVSSTSDLTLQSTGIVHITPVAQPSNLYDNLFPFQQITVSGFLPTITTLFTNRVWLEINPVPFNLQPLPAFSLTNFQIGLGLLDNGPGGSMEGINPSNRTSMSIELVQAQDIATGTNVDLFITSQCYITNAGTSPNNLFFIIYNASPTTWTTPFQMIFRISAPWIGIP